MAFKISYFYDFFTKLCRQLATVILNHDNVYIPSIGQGEDRHRKYKRLKLSGGKAYDQSSGLCLYLCAVYEKQALSAAQNIDWRPKRMKVKAKVKLFLYFN